MLALLDASKTLRNNGPVAKQVGVMVTAGANQAFTNLVLALLDAEDRAVLFKPYYFNHLMVRSPSIALLPGPTLSGSTRAVRFVRPLCLHSGAEAVSCCVHVQF